MHHSPNNYHHGSVLSNIVVSHLLPWFSPKLSSSLHGPPALGQAAAKVEESWPTRPAWGAPVRLRVSPLSAALWAVEGNKNEKSDPSVACSKIMRFVYKFSSNMLPWKASINLFCFSATCPATPKGLLAFAGVDDLEEPPTYKPSD